MTDNKMNGKDFVLGAVVGGLLGAMAALLLAPKSGKELREDIAGQYQGVSEKTRELASSVSSKTQEAAKQVSAATAELTGKVKELAEIVKDDVQSWREARKESTAGDGEAAVAVEITGEDELTKS